MIISRASESKLKELSEGFPAIAVIGPRQSGKTTLVKKVFPKKEYVLLEDPETRFFAEEDPRGFLEQFPEGAIIDEAQRVPVLFSYLQGILDFANIPGMFILTGSQNFLLMEKITQSLAGRIAILKLLPFSMRELDKEGIFFDDCEEYMFKGMFPRSYDMKINPRDFYSSYVQTYIERDLRQIKNVHDLSLFQKFLKMCAYRSGKLLNLSSLANDCGITHNTAKAWISILETSFLVFLLNTYHKNFNKRLVKMPKLYFTDMGLAAYLAGIQDVSQLKRHPLKGALYESFVISEFLKKRFNNAEENNIYFWRDKVGHEVDCLIEDGVDLIPVEIKSGKTINSDFFKDIEYWNRLSGGDPERSFVIYGGNENQKRKNGNIHGFRKFYEII